MSASFPPTSGVDHGEPQLPTSDAPSADAGDPGGAPLSLSPESAERIRAEIGRAAGREVCFLAEVTPGRVIVSARAVARGNRAAVLAAARDAPEGGIMIHNHPSGSLEPSDADLVAAARLFEEGLGTGIVDNDASALYVVVEPPKARTVEPLEVDDLDALVAPGGALSTAHEGYEDRPGQRQMLAEVANRYNEGGISVIEAGTGTGKSLAYLVPAAAWAIRNDERTVVSTATINLQEQLVGKDLPLVRRLVEGDFRWALYKGRGNYISIRRLRLAAESAPLLFEDDRGEELQGLLDWVETTADGSLADLSSPPSDEVWEEVRSDTDICLRARCPHFQQCFFQQARRQAASADVLVVNHHLLFTDLAVRRATQNFTQSAVLPPYRHVVLDEAHNVEDAATSNLGVNVTRVGLFRTLARLDWNGKGVLTAIHRKLLGRPDDGDARRILARIEERVRPALEGARADAGLFYDALSPVAPEGRGEAARLGSEHGIPEPLERVEIAEGLERLLRALARLENEVAELAARVEIEDAWKERLEGRLLDLQSLQRRLAAAGHALRVVLDPDEAGDSHVRWIERRAGRSRGGNLSLEAAPIEPAQLLRKSLFEKVDTAVLTSATLTTRRRFDFLRRRLGLGHGFPGHESPGAPADAWHDVDASGAAPPVVERDALSPSVHERVVPSSFDYRSQALFGVVTGLSGPGGGGRFHEETAELVADMAELTGGGIFTLFTSHSALRAVADRLRALGVEGRFPLLVHGEGPRSRLVAEFTDSGRAVLLGTSSFWEGVDVPGWPLRGLVLHKLPFRVPTEPIVEARLEAVERRGENPFWSYMLPLAALRLKQGFGRLIRSTSDQGCVLLLDDRILSRRYGRYLRDSLPEAPLVKGPWPEVRMALSRFYLSADPAPVD